MSADGFEALEHASPIVQISNGVPTTTSMRVANGTRVQHKNVLELVRDNLADFEEFGTVAFETQPFDTAGGVQRREVAILNEEHATQQRYGRCKLPPLSIGGFTVSNHARIRMAARLIEPQWVAEALVSPSRPNGTPGTRKFLGDKAMCVVNVREKLIITVGYGRLNDPEKGGWS